MNSLREGGRGKGNEQVLFMINFKLREFRSSQKSGRSFGSGSFDFFLIDQSFVEGLIEAF